MDSKMTFLIMCNFLLMVNGQNANKILRVGSIFPEVNQKLAFAGMDEKEYPLPLLANCGKFFHNSGDRVRRFCGNFFHKSFENAMVHF